MKKPRLNIDQKDIDKITNTYQTIKSNIETGKATKNDYQDFANISQQFKLLQKIISLEKMINESVELSKANVDQELIELAKEEIESNKQKVTKLRKNLYLLLYPPEDEKFDNCIMEIRAGAGGDEASLFAADLQRMYTLYTQRQNWKITILDISNNETGGIKTVILRFEGAKVYKHLVRESGVHRVQRVPVTESSGRIHTSTATVAVLPELSDVEIEIKPQDIKIETMKSSGPGGQSVNTTDSAVRITHKPTGIVISCRESKSQLQNRDRGMQILKSKLYEEEKRKQNREIMDQRSNQIGTGDRSEKIRTYNFQQDRVTDHRIKVSWHNIPKIMDGFIDDIVKDVSIIHV